jgi:hypothetical protein
MPIKISLLLLCLTPSLALAGEPANGTLIMVSGVSVWILLSSGFLLWKEVRKNRGPKQD